MGKCFFPFCVLPFPVSVSVTGLSGQMGVGAGTKPADWASGLTTELKPIFNLDKDTVLPKRHYYSILAIQSHHSEELECVTFPSRTDFSEKIFAEIRSQSDRHVMVSKYFWVVKSSFMSLRFMPSGNSIS